MVLDGGWRGGAALKLVIKMDAGALPLPPAHLPGRIQAHQVHQVLQRGGGPGCAAAGAQRHPPGEEALGGVPWVLGGDPPVPGGGVASRWVRQDLVDGSLPFPRESSCLPGGGDLSPKTGQVQGAPAPRVVWCPACPGVLGKDNAGETGIRCRAGSWLLRWREGGDGTPPSQHPPALGSPVPCPCRPPQSLAIKTASLAEAENMADLIDGYCRLQGDLETSLIVFPSRGECPGRGGHRPRQPCPPMEPVSALSTATASAVALE